MEKAVVVWKKDAWVLVCALCVVLALLCFRSGGGEHYNGQAMFFGGVFLFCALVVSSLGRVGLELAVIVKATFCVMVFVVVLLESGYAFGADILTYFFPQSAYGYAWKYGVRKSTVVIEAQPHDCEWDTAPLGSKHCHYDGRVAWIVRAADGVSLRASYDEGKTWSATAATEPAVFVSWTKIND